MKAPLGLLLAVLFLSGCAAKSSGTPEPAAPAAASASAAATTAPEPTISLPAGLPKNTATQPPTDDFQQVVTQGAVRVTGQCVDLVTDRLTWTLIGPAAAGLRDGQRAKVTGVPDPNNSTACTGSPLLVSAATPM